MTYTGPAGVESGYTKDTYGYDLNKWRATYVGQKEIEVIHLDALFGDKEYQKIDMSLMLGMLSRLPKEHIKYQERVNWLAGKGEEIGKALSHLP